MIRQTLATAVSVAALASAKAALAQAAPLLDVTLKPGAADTQGHVAFVDIVTKIPAADTPAGAPLLSSPVVVANVEGVAKTMTGFEVVDAQGALSHAVRNFVRP